MTTYRKGWTKGPWSIAHQNVREHQYGGSVRHWQAPVCVGAPENQGNTIAIVYSGGPGATSGSKDAVVANAHLLANAERLFEALEALLAEMRWSKSQQTYDAAVSEAEAALKAADGEEQS